MSIYSCKQSAPTSRAAYTVRPPPPFPSPHPPPSLTDPTLATVPAVLLNAGMIVDRSHIMTINSAEDQPAAPRT